MSAAAAATAETDEVIAVQDLPRADDIGSQVEAELESLTNGFKEVQQHIAQLQQIAMPVTNGLLVKKEEEPPPVPVQQQQERPRVQELERQLQERTDERETLKNQLLEAEKRLATLPNIDLKDHEERTAVQETLEKLTATLKEQTDQCARFERQNNQLHTQVKALKEVISVHKDLLAIRSLESDQLKTTIKLLEQHAQAEKDRRAAVLAKMEAAVRLNAELKSEYETQLRIFQDLKGKYEYKVDLLNAENERLRNLVPVEIVAEVAPADEIAEQ